MPTKKPFSIGIDNCSLSPAEGESTFKGKAKLLKSHPVSRQTGVLVFQCSSFRNFFFDATVMAVIFPLRARRNPTHIAKIPITAGESN